MPKAIIIGATSGIGEAVALELARQGYTLGLAGRREALLAELAGRLTTPVFTRRIDVALPDEAMEAASALIAEMGGVDLFIIAAGIGIPNPQLAWEPERDIVQVNAVGFMAMANVAYHHCAAQGGGHLVGISSIAGIRGSRWAPAYSASKAFMSNYLEALRARARHQGVQMHVTDIRPGFVDTPMTRGKAGMFWVAPVDVSARQIVSAIRRKARTAYITRRWVLIAGLLRILPDWVLERI